MEVFIVEIDKSWWREINCMSSHIMEIGRCTLFSGWKTSGYWFRQVVENILLETNFRRPKFADVTMCGTPSHFTCLQWWSNILGKERLGFVLGWNRTQIDISVRSGVGQTLRYLLIFRHTKVNHVHRPSDIARIGYRGMNTFVATSWCEGKRRSLCPAFLSDGW